MRPPALCASVVVAALAVLALGGCVAPHPTQLTHEQLGHPASCSTDAEPAASCALQPDQDNSPRTPAEEAELSFLMGIVPHQTQAVEMAQLCEQRAEDVGVLALCASFVEGQGLLLHDMQSGALAWYGQQPSEVVSALDARQAEKVTTGILTDEDMNNLNSLRGRAFEMSFTAEMIEHHEGAITSALLIEGIAPHTQVQQWARAIVASQQRDLESMEQWQKDWATDTESYPAAHG